LEWSWKKLEAEMQPVEILMDLVISEELDPWDIDISDIANRFIKEVKRMQKLNLRLSGKTILAASILLRMKSDSLVPKEEPELIEDFFGWDVMGEETREDIMPIGTPVRRRAERKTTLFELIEALQRALNEEMIRKNFPGGERPKPKMVIPIDEETIKERMTKIYATIQNLTEKKEIIKFSDLLSGKREDIIVVLVTLLYLDSQRQITIWQKELFGEIFIALN
jgi:segregation and condensation protein A